MQLKAVSTFCASSLSASGNDKQTFQHTHIHKHTACAYHSAPPSASCRNWEYFWPEVDTLLVSARQWAWVQWESNDGGDTQDEPRHSAKEKLEESHKEEVKNIKPNFTSHTHIFDTSPISPSLPSAYSDKGFEFLVFPSPVLKEAISSHLQGMTSHPTLQETQTLTLQSQLTWFVYLLKLSWSKQQVLPGLKLKWSKHDTASHGQSHQTGMVYWQRAHTTLTTYIHLLYEVLPQPLIHILLEVTPE